MTDPFKDSFDALILVEGGYADDPSDSGGRTRYGITERTARANGYHGPMDQLSLGVARSIYRVQYWEMMRLDQVAALAPSVAHEMFDTGVNMGQARAVTFLQRWLNGFNAGGTMWDDMLVDGLMGPVTLMALRDFLRIRGDEGAEVLYSVLNGSQAAYYLDLVERREKDERFLWGWARTRIARSR